MQTVTSAFTAEERDSVRSIAQNLQVSWKRFSTLGSRTFTIGVSTIGGNDVIGINPGAIGSPSNYKYFDETDYVTSLAWERGLNMPIGGLNKALAEAVLDNTSGRFTPRYMGGQSELFTAILPRRPMIINAGFEISGVDEVIPQFAGIFTKQPNVDMRRREVRIQAADYIDFFKNRFLDNEVMFTGQRTDQVYEDLLVSLGLSTAQYDLDMGINTIPFGIFPRGTSFAHIFHQLAEAENGNFYQDESGIFRFENRQHWDSSPHNTVSRIVLTGQVIEAETPSEDHIINVVEINANVRNKQPEQVIFNLNAFDSIYLAANEVTEVFVNFEDPILAMITPSEGGQDSFFIANTADDGSGTDMTSSVSIVRVDQFAEAAKLHIRNSSTTTNVYITSLVISGRPAKIERELYYRAEDDSSLTAYEERKLTVENDFIQNETWAESLAQMILDDYAEIENLQRITIRAMPSLQLGDLVSWQGRYWRIFNIKTRLSPSEGFIQELMLLQREIRTYFRIGISTIGSEDRISP